MDRRNRPDRSADPVARAGLRRTDGLVRGRRTPGDGAAHRDARTELSQWLVAGREAKGLRPEQVAQITRIQLRTIERLEDGRFDELPADVFVRGFIRGYARCVGLPVDEALARYGSCGFAAAPVASAQAQALLDSMSSLAPTVVSPRSLARAPRIFGLGADAVEVGDLTDDRDATAADSVVVGLPALAAGSRVDVVPAAAQPTARSGSTAEISAVLAGEAAEDRSTKRKRRKKAGEPATGAAVRDSRGRFVRRTGVLPAVELAALGLEDKVGAEAEIGSEAEVGAPVASLADAVVAPVITPAAAIESRTLAAAPAAAPTEAAATEPAGPATDDDEVVVRSLAALTSGVGRVTGRHVALPPRTSGIIVAPTPTLSIDDDDPEDAERAREARLAPRKEADKGWRSFLPPALLDQQRGRQGGLTLAVIILLIVATLTLSYLMRRPSSTGEGITERSAPALRVVG